MGKEEENSEIETSSDESESNSEVESEEEEESDTESRNRTVKNEAKKPLLSFKRNVKVHPIQDVESSTKKRRKISIKKVKRKNGYSSLENSTSTPVVEKQEAKVPIEKSKKKKK